MSNPLLDEVEGRRERTAAFGCDTTIVPIRPTDVLITAELASRPRKTPNLAAEVAAFCELSALLVSDPQRTVKRLLELAIKLCEAGSAGLSLLESDVQTGQHFRWDRLAGPIEIHLNATTPRNFSPCGMCLEAGHTILVSRPFRAFDYFKSAVEPLMEGLVVPLYDTGGLPLGTIWIVHHEPKKRFDAEDARVMEQLAVLLVLALKFKEDRLNDAKNQAEVSVLRAENAHLIDEGAFLKSVLKSSGDCIAVLDLGGEILFMNPAGQELMEVDDFASIRGKVWRDFWKDEGRLAASEAIQAARAGGTGRFRAEANTLQGTPKHWDVQLTPIFDEEDTPQLLLSISRDVSEERKAEEHRRFLAYELEHRLRNSLAMVSAIVSQTFRTAVSKEDALNLVLTRIIALSRAQDILTKTSWKGASIIDLIEGALSPHQSGEGRYRLSGPDIMLSPRHSLSLALAIHELATNATKYGALSNSVGYVDVRWSIGIIDGEARFRFDWKEIDGPPVAKPERRGFGSRLIEQILASDFGTESRIEYAPSGVNCSVTSSLESLQSG
jgi:PAS domain S-box-containing protein